jgi:Immunity protein Imm1
MFVNDMLCDWAQGRPWGKNLTWESIESAIRQLDGRHRSEVSIAGNGEAHMSITGGSGVYLISATPNNDIFYELRNSAGAPEKSIKLVSGGQMVTVSAEEAVDLEMALRAARTFAETGEFDKSLTWETNPPTPPESE